MIPKIIHQIYFDLHNKKIEDIPLFKTSSERIQKLNPDYKYILWSEDECNKLVKEKLPEYYDFYNSMRYKIQQIDYIRFVILYLYGGFYVDLDLINLKNLDNLLNQKFIGYTLRKFVPEHREFIQNDFFGVEKKFKLFKILMDLCEPNYNIKASNKIYDSWKARFVLQTTGPRYVSKIFKKILPKYKPERNLIYTKWRNDNWKDYNKNDFYFENYVSGGWLESMSNNKASKNFYLKEDEL
tara:strand:+ start:8521 stop:9240 length:720 start_codon:yes stop_codon:yes gene_type:complete